MTYKEAIVNSFMRVQNDDGSELNIIPAAFPLWLMNISAVMAWCCDQLCGMPAPVIEGIEGIENFEAMDKPAGADRLMEVLTGVDYSRHLRLYLQLQGFLTWMLDEDIPDQALSSEFWFSHENVARKWNEYAMAHGDDYNKGVDDAYEA